MSGGVNDLNALGPVGTSTRAERMAGLEEEARRIRSCKPCFRGDHAKCTGSTCRCEETPRCAENAALVFDRLGPP